MRRELILHMPVVHQGYLDLIAKSKPDRISILGEDLIADFPFLERDMRALSPMIMIEAVAGIVCRHITPDKEFDVAAISKGYLAHPQSWLGNHIMMPKEDVTLALAEKYFPDQEVEWFDSFLRWNKWNAGAKAKVNPSHSVSSSEFDKMVMSEAFASAQKSPDWWRQVGVVLVKESKVLYSSYNSHLPSERTVYIDGDPRSSFNAGENIDLSCALHGERDVISWAAKTGTSLLNADIYVTTFPCPGCARSIVASGIKRVFYAEGYSLLDADELFKACGIDVVRVEFNE